MMIASGGLRRMCAIAWTRVYVLTTWYPCGARILASDRLDHSCLLAISTSTGRADGGVFLLMRFLSGRKSPLTCDVDRGAGSPRCANTHAGVVRGSPLPIE